MRKKLRKRILIFSVIVAFIFLILATGIFTAFGIIWPYHGEMKAHNSDAIRQIDHKENIYDISKLVNEPTYEGSDYILTKENFFIWFSNDYPNFILNYSEPNFIEHFRTPDDYITPTNEQWRLYSRSKLINNRKNIEILVGWGEKTSDKMVETPASPEIDVALKKQADNIADGLEMDKESGKVHLTSEVRPRVDGYQVVDTDTKEVINWSWSMPAFFPEKKPLPKKGLSFFSKGDEIFLVRTDCGNDLIAVSLNCIGNIRWLGMSSFIVFLFMFLLSYVISSTFLKKYFILFHKNQPSISEALKSGEGQKIEFKRGFIDDDILKSITAFANTNDGTIFIGIDDEGKITGIDLKTPKEKDKFRTKISNLIRNKIEPYLLVDINFDDIRGYIVAKIFVPRGEELFYFLGGLIYIRDGNADRKAPPEIIKGIAAKYYAL